MLGNATKMIQGLGDRSYEGRLKESGLATFGTRRLRVEHFLKILNGYEYVDRNIFSHSRKIVELEDINQH